ncbi:MAG: hypothetical protein COA45_08020 [Zetaproteobacteria bacterium]|nr:MAG: hypothetical protein COA45_08020 [Zetaproteobacteria bacterium]
MNSFKLPLYLTALFFLISPVAVASELIKDTDSLEKLLNLDIEELMMVTVASKKEEAIKEAPSVITVITKEDIHRYGALNLTDIMTRIPSMQTYLNLLPDTSFSFRGQSSQLWVARVLFLINGRPFRDSWSGGVVTPLIQNFPLSAIEKIEVIRGPGSVLYGTNAFSGVINIVTKKTVDNGVAELSGTYGSFSRHDFEGSASYEGDDWNVLIAAKDSHTDGWRSTLTDELGVTDSFESKEGGNGVLLSANYKNFDANFFYGRSKSGTIGTAPIFPSGTVEPKRIFVDLGYKFDITDNWNVNMNITSNNFEFGRSSAGLNNAKAQAHDILGEVSTRLRLMDNLDVLLGAVGENHDGHMLPDVEYQRHSYSAYAQADYKPFDWLKLVGGIQMNHPTGIKRDYSPRAAAIISLDNHVTIKAMYGQAFRSAYAIEADINFAPILIGNNNIKPEKIETGELQFFYQNRGIEASLNLYRSRITDIISRVSIPGSLQFQNTGEEVYEGIELEGKKRFDNGWTVEGSVLMQQSENSDDLENPNFTTNIMAKGGVTYESDNGWTIGIFDSYFGDPEDVRGANASVLEVNPQPKSYHMVTGNLNLNIPKLLGKEGLMPDATFTIFGENLLNEDIHYPEFNRKNINSLPIEGGRAIYGKLSIKF